MDTTQYNRLVSFIWNIANDVLRDVYVRGKYRDVILPMTVLRRLDALLTPTHEAVLQQKRELDAIGLKDQHDLLCGAAGFDFYNTSPFTLAGVRASGVGNVRADFEAWLDGFSPNVQEIITRFAFRPQLKKLEEADRLMGLLERFLSPSINLSPKDVLDPHGKLIHPGLSNLGMGYVFEELLRRFSEENNEEAGEHFTPREVVRLMASLVVYPVRERNLSTTLTIYDCACGTGGMLTEAETMIMEIARAHGHTASVHLRGQESSDETWAICQADLLIKGEAHARVEYGSTLSADAFKRDRFDFMLANPPYGKSWKLDLEKLPAGNKQTGEKVNDPRFNVTHQGESLSLVTRSEDGQLMFLVNMLAKMKPVDEAAHAAGQVTGSRIATIHNGSSIMTGSAGQGESNIRRWVIENDWLEAVIALPENLFYNTPLKTYVWVLSNDKAPKRRGKVQLIDATERFEKLRRNLGKKNCQLSDADVNWVLDTYEACEDSEHSKVFPNAAFGYWQITVERPLRLRVDLDDEAREALASALMGTKDEGLLPVVEAVAKTHGAGPHCDWNALRLWVANAAKKLGTRVTDKGWKALRATLATTDPEAEPVRSEKSGYEPDPELRDRENVPMTDGIDAYFKREVLPYAPDAWVDEGATVIGYEIPFTRHFYKPARMRSLVEIANALRTLEQESEGILAQMLGRDGKAAPEPYREYRDSGVPWIGRVPSHWTIASVSQLGRVQGGKQLAARAPGVQRPYLRVANVFDGYIDATDVATMPFTDADFARYKLHPDDILLNEGQSIELVGRTARYQGTPSQCAFQNSLIRVQSGPQISASYCERLFRYCQASGIFSMIATQTTSIAHLGVGRFARLQLCAPTVKEEQAAIARFLEEKEHDIERAIRLYREKIAVMEEYRARLIADAVTGQIDVRSRD